MNLTTKFCCGRRPYRRSRKDISRRPPGRVARAGYPARALARSGLGVFHRPAPPLMRLARPVHLVSKATSLATLNSSVYISSVSMHRSCFPLEDRTNTGRLCSPGSGYKPLPRVKARMQPSDFQAPIGPRSGSPCLDLPLRKTLLFGCPMADSVAASPYRQSPRRIWTGPPRPEFISWRNLDLPGAWAVPFVHAKVDHSAGCVTTSPALRLRHCCLQGC